MQKEREDETFKLDSIAEEAKRVGIMGDQRAVGRVRKPVKGKRIKG